MADIPKTWTTIAVFSNAENRFVPVPGAALTEAQVIGNPAISRKYATISGRRYLQIRKK